MTYHNENKCPPLINKRKKRGKPAPIPVQLIPVVEVNALE
jgi:NosR/NirI family nitrous oxide reductase transcriptional regulator